MPVYTAVRSNGKPAVLINITRQPSGNTVAVANGVAAEMAQLQSKLPPGVHIEPFYDQSELVRRKHFQRPRRDSDRPGSRLHHPVPVSSRLDFFSGRRPGHPCHRRGDHSLSPHHRPELQPDDPGRSGCGHRAGHRRCDCGGREHRGPSRSGRVADWIRAQGHPRDQPAAGLFHHHAGDCLSTPGLRHPGYRKLLPRACRNHDGCFAYLPAARPYLHSGALSPAGGAKFTRKAVGVRRRRRSQEDFSPVS